MIECHIPAQTRTPFPASRDFPSRGNERYEGKNSESYTSRTISAFSLFGGCRHHLARWEACHMTQKVNPVTLALYSSPDRAIPQPSARRAVKLKNPPARKGRSILRTFSSLRTFPSEPSEPSEPYEPSRRRRVHVHVQEHNFSPIAFPKRGIIKKHITKNFRYENRSGMPGQLQGEIFC